MKNSKIILITIISLSLFGCEKNQKESFVEADFVSEIQTAIVEATGSEHSSVNTANDYSERGGGYSIKLLEIQIFDDKKVVNQEIDFQSAIGDVRNNINLDVLRKNYDLIKISFLIENEEDYSSNEVIYEYVNYTNTFAEGDNSLSTKDLTDFDK